MKEKEDLAFSELQIRVVCQIKLSKSGENKKPVSPDGGARREGEKNLLGRLEMLRGSKQACLGPRCAPMAEGMLAHPRNWPPTLNLALSYPSLVLTPFSFSPLHPVTQVTTIDSFAAMNSYFDHSTGFYGSSHNGATDLHHQSPYRSFHPSLAIAGQNTSYHQGSWPNSTFNHSDTSSPYVDAACKLYYGSNHSVAFKSDCSLTKEQNAFKAPSDHQLSTGPSSWHHSSPLRTPASAISPSMATPFDPSCTRSNVSDCSACCTNPATPSSGIESQMQTPELHFLLLNANLKCAFYLYFRSASSCFISRFI